MCKVSSSLHFLKTPSHTSQESSTETYWVPNTDVYVGDGGLVVKVELAGMRREDLELEIGALGRFATWRVARNGDGGRSVPVDAD